MMTTQSMQRFEHALDKLRCEDNVFLNQLYWANTCPECSEDRSVNCGRGWRVLTVMGRLTFSLAIELEVS